MLNFDHNATAPLCPAARDAWLQAHEQYPGNPSSRHRLGQRADRALENAREEIAALLGAELGEIIWTSGATEGANTAFAHLAEGAVGEAWISALEHPCVREAARRYFPSRVWEIPSMPSGVMDLPRLREELAHRRPKVVAVMAANNETGVWQPWAEVAELCAAHEIPLVCDATQWLGKAPAAELGRCTYLLAGAHKFGGPLGVGVLKAPTELRPLIVGGPHEEGRRAGTENLAGVLAMLAALRVREAALSAGQAAPRQQWRDDFIRAVLAAAPGARVLGAEAPRLWNTVSVLFPAHDCRYQWAVKLDRHGVAASTGSACSGGEEKPSPVLASMGLTQEEMRRVVRFSSGWETTEAEWQQLLQVIHQVSAELAN